MAMGHLGRFLKAHREAAGLTQEQLAAKMGINRTNYLHIEKGGSVGPKTMQRLCEVPELGLDMELLEVLKAVDDFDESKIQRLLSMADEIRRNPQVGR